MTPYRSIVGLMPILLLACQSTGTGTYRAVFDQDATLILQDDKTIAAKNGEEVELPIGAVTVTRPAYQSLVLVPLPGEPGSVRVHLSQQGPKRADVSAASPTATTAANTVARSVVEIQLLIAQDHPDEALTKIQALRTQDPSFTYLQFLAASCFLRKNDLPRAREATAAALKEFPSDSTGLALMSELDHLGGSVPSQPSPAKEP